MIVKQFRITGDTQFEIQDWLDMKLNEGFIFIQSVASDNRIFVFLKKG